MYEKPTDLDYSVRLHITAILQRSASAAADGHSLQRSDIPADAVLSDADPIRTFYDLQPNGPDHELQRVLMMRSTIRRYHDLGVQPGDIHCGIPACSGERHDGQEDELVHPAG
jgi:hypothetical protein